MRRILVSPLKDKVISINRALNCTREMVCGHIDELAIKLQEAGIMANAMQVAPGKRKGNVDMTQVYNHDETPQFVNYRIDSTASGLCYAAKGESCKKNDSRKS